MGAIQRGTSIFLVEYFWTIDPLTQDMTPSDPATVVFTLQDPNGVDVIYEYGIAPNVTNPAVGAYVVELPPGLPTGLWTCLVTGDNVEGSSAGTLEVTDEFTFEILASGVLAPADPDVSTFGPCQPWIDGSDVAEYDSTLGVGSDFFLLDDVASMASQVMFEASGRQFAGICHRTVRPCRDSCACWGDAAGFGMSWGWAMFGAGYGGWSGGWGWKNECGDHCGCGTLSKVRLAGYPVREILEVKIDGVALAKTGEYRLDSRTDLVRLDDPGPPFVQRKWPACQNLSLDDTQAGTFSVKYQWGQQPPLLGKLAAAALAAQLFRSINPGMECKIPTSVTRIVRTGITIERIVATAKMIRDGSTGIPPIDIFISTVNPQGARRRSAVFTPDVQRYARKVGQ